MSANLTSVPNAVAVQRLPLHPRDVAIIGALMLCFRPAASTYAKAPAVSTSVMTHIWRVVALEVAGVRGSRK